MDGASHVAHLTIGYRVPGPILDVANRLLPFTAVASEASRSVRTGGEPPVERVVAAGRTGGGRRRRGARRAPPSPQHRRRRPPERFAELHDALADVGLHAVDRVHDLAHDDVPDVRIPRR